MTKILIDLSTIELNKDYAPGCCSYVRGPMRITFTCKGALPESFVEGENIIVDSFELDSISPDKSYYTGMIIGDIDVQALQKEKCDVTLKYEREPMEVSSFEDRQWFFKYEPTFVKCTKCGSTFSHEYLESDEADCGDNYSSRICPVCGEWDCCEIEYEDIKEALLRKAIIESPTPNDLEQQMKDLQDFEQEVIAKTYGVKKEDLK